MYYDEYCDRSGGAVFGFPRHKSLFQPWFRLLRQLCRLQERLLNEKIIKKPPFKAVFCCYVLVLDKSIFCCTGFLFFCFTGLRQFVLGYRQSYTSAAGAGIFSLRLRPAKFFCVIGAVIWWCGQIFVFHIFLLYVMCLRMLSPIGGKNFCRIPAYPLF